MESKPGKVAREDMRVLRMMKRRHAQQVGVLNFYNQGPAGMIWKDRK